MLKSEIAVCFSIVCLFFNIPLSIGDECIENDPKFTCIRDFKIDVLLMVDSSGSIAETNYKYAIDAVIDWINSYFDVTGVQETQFAYLDCSAIGWNRSVDKVVFDNVIKHKFRDGNFQDAIVGLLDNYTAVEGTGDNADLCGELAADEIFTEKDGDRTDAQNIIIYLSDCQFTQPDMEKQCRGNMHRFCNISQRHKNAAKILQVDKKAEFFFLCYKANRGGKEEFDALNSTCWKNIMEWLSMGNRSNSSVILFDNENMTLSSFIDKVVPMVKVNVTDCEMRNFTSPCEWNGGKTHCVQKFYFDILQDNFPKPNMGGRAGLACLESNVNGSIINCTDCAITTEPPKPDEHIEVVNITEKSNTLWIIVGVLLGLLVLAIILLVVFFLIKKRRERHNKSEGCSQKDRREKSENIAVDMNASSQYSDYKNDKSIAPKSPKNDKSIGQKSPKKVV